MSGTKHVSSNAEKQDAPNARKGNKRHQKAQGAKTRARRNLMQTLTPQEALQLLASAVSYCQQAGLQVYATNAIEGLRFYIPLARYVETADGGAAFVLDEIAPTLPTAGATN